MVRQRITTYKTLTLQRQSKLLAEIQACRTARIAAGLSPDSPERDEQEAPDAELAGVEIEDEEEE